MRGTTICVNMGGLTAVLILLLSCTSDTPPQSQPKTSATPQPRIAIDSPEDGTVGLSVTFRWHIQDAKEGESYRYKVRLDKGPNACDGGIEEEFDAETKTCLKVDLPPDRYNNASVDFAVQATDSQGRKLCSQGRRFVVDHRSPSSPGCDSAGDKNKDDK